MSRVFKLPPRPSLTPAVPERTEEQIAASRRSRTSRARGRGFEKSVATDIREALGAHPEDVKRTPAAIGGKDIVLHHALRPRFPYSVEAKNCKTLQVPAWIAQSEAAASKEGAGLEPIVVFKLPQNSKKYVIVEFDHFLKLAVDYYAEGNLHEETEDELALGRRALLGEG